MPQEWSDSLPRELDFCHEMEALERAGNKLREVRRPGAECTFSHAPGRKQVKRLCLDYIFFGIVTSSAIVFVG